MPRGPRLDAPGALHHVIARGIADEPIFRDQRDRTTFLDRLADLVRLTGLRVYAWALLPTHVHVFARTGNRPLPRVMRSLLTGHAITFNRRHGRHGHLFQNRYKSIVVEEEPYFLELIRYVHLNPLRMGLVKTLDGLEAYEWTGHSAIMGRCSRPWQEAQEVLQQFDTSLRRARVRYRQFVGEGVAQGRRTDLQGGGLVRSAGGWAAVAELRRGREAFISDERILGSSEFAQSVLAEVERVPSASERTMTLDRVVADVCQASGVTARAVVAGGRSPALSRAREGICYIWTDVLGGNGRAASTGLGVTPSSVSRAAQRGRQRAEQWRAVLEKQ